MRIKCNEDDTIGDLKKLIAAQTGTKYELKMTIYVERLIDGDNPKQFLANYQLQVG